MQPPIENDPRKTVSEYLIRDNKLNRMVLNVRPNGSLSIIEEVQPPIKLILHQTQSPGDHLMLSAAIRDLHRNYPGSFVTDVRTPCKGIWKHNPHIFRLDTHDSDTMHVRCEYPLVHLANTGQYHFIHGFRKDLQTKLGLDIIPGNLHADIHLTPEEVGDIGEVARILGHTKPYWVVNAGGKTDFTCKHWEYARYQEVVATCPDITFVQVGAKEHIHPALTGANVINFVGKTDARELINLIYHSVGVISPVSFPMHLAAAIPVHPKYKRHSRPCITIAGGRETPVWEGYHNHTYLHTCGQLPCCSLGGCWKSRVTPLGDGDEKDFKDLCDFPVATNSGQTIPKCMSLITADDVVRQITQAMSYFD
jgi:ADP-heptose:LPS heptosyltransferase